jgi:serine/threonine protein kinase
MRAAVRAGTIIAGFRVRSLIGEGAMGAVYLAENVSSGGHVALKILAPELARDERFRQRFLPWGQARRRGSCTSRWHMSTGAIFGSCFGANGRSSQTVPST